MGEAYNGGFEEPPAPSTPPEQPATTAPVPPSAASDAEETRTPFSDNADKTSAAGADQDEQPHKGTETGAQVEEKPASGTNPPSSPGRTPDRDGDHANAVVEDVDAVLPEGCTTPPPPPAHDSEGSDTHSADDDGGHGSPLRLRGESPTPARAGGMRDVAAASSSRLRLRIFRSFSRDKKAKKPGDAAPGPMHGKDGGEREEEEVVRRKSFWK